MNFKQFLRATSLILGGIAASFAANSWLLELRHNVTPYSGNLGACLLWLYIVSSILGIVIALVACSFKWNTYACILTILSLAAASVFAAFLMTDIMAGLDKMHPLISYNRSVYVVPFILILIGRFFKKTKGSKLRTISEQSAAGFAQQAVRPQKRDARPSLLNGQRNRTERPLHNSQGEMK